VEKARRNAYRRDLRYNFISPRRLLHYNSGTISGRNVVKPFLIALSSMFAVYSTFALSDDAGSAMKDFGLVGTWSFDCAKDPVKDAYATRDTYSVPRLFGKPTMVMTFVQKSGDLTVRTYEIESATRITEEKIRIEVTLIKTEHSISQANDSAPSSGGSVQFLLQKVGSRLMLLESRAGDQVLVENGISNVNHRPMQPEERCLNE
jgi:hypothetical protein